MTLQSTHLLTLGHNPTMRRSNGKIPVELWLMLGQPDEIEFEVKHVGDYYFELPISLIHLHKSEWSRTIYRESVTGRIGDTLRLKNGVSLRIDDTALSGIIVTFASTATQRPSMDI